MHLLSSNIFYTKMHWYSQQMWFLIVKHFLIKVKKKPGTQCLMPKYKNQILDDDNIQKANKNPKFSSKKICWMIWL